MKSQQRSRNSKILGSQSTADFLVVVEMQVVDIYLSSKLLPLAQQKVIKAASMKLREACYENPHSRLH